MLLINHTPSLRSALLFTLFLSLVIPLSAQVTGSTYKDAKQSKTATFFYLYEGGVPELIGGEEKEADGLLVEIMGKFEDYLKEKEGISVTSTYKKIPNKNFKAFMAQVKSAKGGVFGLSNVSIKEERKKHYLFSPPYLKNVSVLITNKSSETLLSMESISSSFAGKKAQSVTASTYSTRLEEVKANYYPDLEIVSHESVQEMIGEVISNNNSFGVVDLLYYLTSVKGGVPIKRHAVGDKSDDTFGIIMPLSNDWEPLIKDFFNSKYINDSEYRLMITKYLGKSGLRLIQGI